MSGPEAIGPLATPVIIALLLGALCSALLISVLLTPLVRDLAHRLGCVDEPDGRRKLHARAVPRVGGVAVYLAFAAAFLLSVAVLPGFPGPGGSAGVHLVIAASAVMMVGLGDDLRGAKPSIKLLVQIAAGLYLYNHGFEVRLLSNPVGEVFTLGWTSLPLTLAWFVLITNAFNLVDGLDGLAAGVALFSCGVVLVFALVNERWEVAVMAVALGGALLGFLRYNFSPASVFLGDSGSLAVGFVLAALSIRGSMKASMAVAIATPLLAFGFPLMDTGLALCRRTLRGRSILEADADHIHHRMLRRGFQPQQAVVVLYGVSGLFAGMALLAMSGQAQAIGVAVAVSSIVTWLVIRQQGEAGVAVAEAGDGGIEAVRSRLRAAGDLSELWEALVEAAVVLRLHGVTLRLEPSGVEDAPRAWSSPAPAPAQSCSWTLPLASKGTRLGELTVSAGVEADDPGRRLDDVLRYLNEDVADVVSRVR